MSANYNIDIHGKRLSTKSMLYKLSRQLPYLALYAYFGIYRDSNQDWVYLIIFLMIGLFAVPSVLLSFFYFKYLITPSELIIQSGIINRKQRNIPLRRIQNVNIQQNFLQRILGISTVKMETAGDVTSEAILDSVGKENATEIREIIRNYQAEIEEDKETEHKSTENQEKSLNEDNLADYEESQKINLEINNEAVNETKKDKSHDDIELISMSLGDVAKFGVLRFRPILLVAVGWFMSMFQQFMPNEFQNIDKYINKGLNNFVFGSDEASMIFYAISGVILALLISWMADIILTVIQFYGFRLSIAGKKLYTNYGLLTKRQGAIPLKKLQMMIIFSNALRSKFGYWGLNLETAGSAGRQGKAPETAVPFAKFVRVVELAKGILSFELPEEYRTVSRKTIRRAFLRYFWLLLILILALSQLTQVWWLSFGMLPIFIMLAIWRWQARGYYLNEDKLIIKEGWFFKRIKIIPISKIQNIVVKANIFQRGMGLASIYLDTAAGSGFNDASVVDIEISSALEISNEISTIFHRLNNSIKIK